MFGLHLFKWELKPFLLDHSTPPVRFNGRTVFIDFSIAPCSWLGAAREPASGGGRPRGTRRLRASPRPSLGTTRARADSGSQAERSVSWVPHGWGARLPVHCRGRGRFHGDERLLPLPHWYSVPIQVHCACANDRVVSVIRMVHWRNLLPWYIFPGSKLLGDCSRQGG